MEKDLLTWLANHDIHYTLHTHPAVFTVPEAKIHSGHISGTHCKNLVLKNKKSGQLYLVTIPYDKSLDLKLFRKMISAPKVRFADEKDLSNVLGLTPGAVSPLGLINDGENKVIFWIDEIIWNAEIICCHPNINTETLQIPRGDFHKIIELTGNIFAIKKDLPYVANKDA
jgi:Ala-tRNA(Pro) deacylase